MKAGSINALPSRLETQMADIGSVMVNVLPVLDDEAMDQVAEAIAERVKLAVRRAVREAVQIQVGSLEDTRAR